MTASSNNSYTYSDVRLVDWLTCSDAYMQYMDFDMDSFELYEGDLSDETAAASATKIAFPSSPTNGSNPDTTTDLSTIRINNSTANTTKHFLAYVGNMEPGEIKTLKYTVTVKPGAFILCGNENNLNVSNSAQAYYNNDSEVWRTSSNVFGGQPSASKSISHKTWERKLMGNALTAEKTITTASGSPEAFTVPKGGYEYRVLINETGDWNVSSTQMTDTLSDPHLQYVGYARLDAYEIPSDQVVDNRLYKVANNRWGSPEEQLAINYLLEDLTIKSTYWIKIDGQQSFTFTPKNLDSALDGTYAYILTYYVKPVNLASITQIVISNSFDYSGSVGIGPYTYYLSGVGVSVSVTIEGSNNFAVSKTAWYYEDSKGSSTDTGDSADSSMPFANGKVHWVINVSGDLIAKDTKIKDNANPTGTTSDHTGYQYVWYDPTGGSDRNTVDLVVYKGKLSKDIKSYENMDAVLEEGSLTLVDTSYYSVSKDTTIESGDPDKTLIFNFDKDIELETGEFLYIFLATDPQGKIESARDYYYYTNAVESQYAGEDWWTSQGEASLSAVGSDNIIKELGYVFTWDGETCKTVGASGRYATGVSTESLKAAGVTGYFIQWEVQVNYNGDLDGRYRVLDTLPDGVEFVYARVSYKDYYYDESRMDPQKDLVEDGWTEHTAIDAWPAHLGLESKYTDYSYSKGNQVIFDLFNLVSSKTVGSRGVQVQVVCRITDEDLLIGGSSDTKVYTNHATLLNSDGKECGTDSQTVQVSGQEALSKTGTYDSSNPTVYPFSITVNPLGEDLIEGGKTITLYDKLGTSLVPDISSIMILNTRTGEYLDSSEFKVTIQTTSSYTLMGFEIPDDQPFIITYDTEIDAAPGEAVEITNNAYWEGYSSTSGSSVTKKNFRYKLSAFAGAEERVRLEILKMDSDDVMKRLNGAEYELQEVTYDASTGKFAAVSGKRWTGTTFTQTINGKTQEGSYIFGLNETLEYNHIYRLTEIKAPDGYELDSTPKYFAIAQATNSDSENPVYPDFPDEVTVGYTGAFYVVQEYNHVPYISLPTTGGTGVWNYRIQGMILAAAASICLLIQNRKKTRKVRR
jgi:hypothetical protein